MLPVTSLSILAFRIFPHSSWQNTSSSEIFFSLLACAACFPDVLHGWFWGMLWINVLLEYPTSLHCISCAPSCKTTPEHYGSTFMLNSWRGFLLYKGFTLSSPNIPCLVVAKKVNFGFVSPKHIAQKASGFFFEYLRCLICVDVCHVGLRVEPSEGFLHIFFCSGQISQNRKEINVLLENKKWFDSLKP